jgi:hypothetical protein
LDDKSAEAKQWREEAEEARQNGEGIRQVSTEEEYFSFAFKMQSEHY